MLVVGAAPGNDLSFDGPVLRTATIQLGNEVRMEEARSLGQEMVKA